MKTNLGLPRVLSLAVVLLSLSSLARAITDVYNASSSWTVPAGVTSVIVEAWGGGGNGAGSLTHGGGGGGGAYARSTLTTSPGTTYTVFVGGPGTASLVRIGAGPDLVRAAAGASATTSTGALGGSTSASVGSVLFAGGRGASATDNGPFGSQIGGGGGGSAFTNAGGEYSGVSTTVTGGNGTGRGGNGGPDGPGTAGQSPGGGGGGSSDGFGSTQGASGRVVLTYEIQVPEINLLGNGLSIASGDTTPSLPDQTDFGTVPVTGNAARTVTFTIQNAGNGQLFLTANPLVSLSGSSDFTVTQPVSSAINPGSAVPFQVTFDPSGPGLRGATLTIANTDANEGTYTFSIQGIGGEPEISVSQASIERANGATVDFGGVAVGESADLVFTVGNSGGDILLLTGTPRVAVQGGQGAFAVIAQPATNGVSFPAGSTSFTVRFTPTLDGAASASITIPNTDANEPDFVLQLTATGLSSANDTDNDGLNDVAELKLSALGFDWQTNQSALVTTYFAHAAEAGLYTAAQLQSLHPGTPQIERDPATGRFRLTLDWRRTTNLSAGFQDFPAPPGSAVTIDPSGDVIFEFPDTAPVIFYRLTVD